MNDEMLPKDLSNRFDSLYRSLQRKYDLTPESVETSLGTLKLFTVANSDDILERVLSESDDPDNHVPYWSVLWPAATVLARHVQTIGDLTGRRIIELGCGLGLAGLAAGQAGAKLLFSDNESDALRFAELNWIKNFRSLPKTQLLDWHKVLSDTPGSGGHFDLVLAADVAYDASLFTPLVNSLTQLLAEEGMILLSEPQRSVAKPFFQKLANRGFQSEIREDSVNLNGRRIFVNVHYLWRK